MAQPDYQSQGAAMKHQPALNDTEMQKRKKKLVDETFDRMLKLLRQLGLNQKSPKFFVIYAHDSKDNELRAHQEVVKNYIAWFKKVLFNVDSDKSPHGWGLVHTVEHAYASLNIIDNQLCLLPTGWHKVNVDYILVFYSKLLASYVRHERSYKDEKSGKTYTEALTDACSKYQDPSKIPWNDLRSDIFKVQEHYSKSMGSGFHHVLTELALLNFRNGRARDIRTTIPIILGLDDCWEEKELHWQVDAIQVEQTQIRIYVKPGKEHLHFFKILMQFESLAEVDRQLIDLLAKCYEDSIGLLESDVSYIQHPEKYDAQLESLITGTLRTLNDQWQSIPRPITVSHIRDSLTLFTKLEQASMLRVTGDLLPDTCNDIDLMISNVNYVDRAPLKSGSEKTQEDGADEKQASRSKAAQSSKVPLSRLFSARRIGDREVRPQRILVQGSPGVGKTTLCKRLMHQYYWNDEYAEQFGLIVRIPAPKLEASGDLASLLLAVYFQDNSSGHKLSAKLASLILDPDNNHSGKRNTESLDLEKNNSESQRTKPVKVLIILDGLDEIQSWPKDRHPLLDNLMKRLHVIITSRLFPAGMFNTSSDLFLDAVGLSIENVNAYLENRGFVSSETGAKMKRFIQSNPSVMDLVRLPIHLDIICYGWNDLLHQDGDSPTTTALYQAVVLSLWRKDVPKLDKRDNGEPVTREVIDALRDATRLEVVVGPECRFLEKIAFELMESNQSILTDRRMAEMIQDLEHTGTLLPLSIEKNFQKLSIFPSHSAAGYSSHNRDYHFIHRTFQDFFAARYLVGDQDRLNMALRTHKYNRRFATTWRFVSGLLSTRADIGSFFELLDREPRDLLGIQHIYLTTRCFYESQHRMDFSLRNELTKRLGDWLRLERRLCDIADIPAEFTFPEDILLTRLRLTHKTNQSNNLMQLLHAISRRAWFSDTLISEVCQIVSRHNINITGLMASKLSANIDSFINSGAYKLLGDDEKWPEPLVSHFMTQIKSKQDHNIAYSLESQRELPDCAIKKLIEWWKTNESPLSDLARPILANQKSLPKEAIDRAIRYLKDESTAFWVRKRPRFWRDTEGHYPLLGDPDRASEFTIMNRCKVHIRSEDMSQILAILVNRAFANEWLPDLSIWRPKFDLTPGDVEDLGDLLLLCHNPDCPVVDCPVASMTHGTRSDPSCSEGFKEIKDKYRAMASNIRDNKLLLAARSRLQYIGSWALIQQTSLSEIVICTLLCLYFESNYPYRSSLPFGRQVRGSTFENTLKALRAQADLPGNISNWLIKRFNDPGIHEYREKIVCVLAGRLHQQMPEALEWLTTNIRGRNIASASFSIVMDSILQEPNLPNSFLDALIRRASFLQERGMSLSQLASIISRKKVLSNSDIEYFVEALPSDLSEGFLLDHDPPALYRREEFAKALVAALEQAKNTVRLMVTSNLLHLHKNLDHELIKRLTSLLYDDCNPGSGLQESKRETTARILSQQLQLDRDTIVAVIKYGGLQRDYTWGSPHKLGPPLFLDVRTLDIFYSSLDMFDERIISRALEMFLRLKDTLPTVFLDGNAICYYNADGKLIKHDLADEVMFREKLRSVYQTLGYPEWAKILPPRTSAAENDRPS